MRLSPDETVFWRHGFAQLNLTIVTTWGLMAVMGVGAWLITRRLTPDIRISKWQNFLEIVVAGIRDQISEVGLPKAERYLPGQKIAWSIEDYLRSLDASMRELVARQSRHDEERGQITAAAGQ